MRLLKGCVLFTARVTVQIIKLIAGHLRVMAPTGVSYIISHLLLFSYLYYIKPTLVVACCLRQTLHGGGRDERGM